jgi:3'-5' exoribonuclease
MNYKELILDQGAACGCKDIAVSFFDSYDPDFSTNSGCHVSRGHHYGTGGLLQHTWEVISLCMSTATFYAENGSAHGKIISDKILFCAALFHDVGKIWDYAKDSNAALPHKRKIHHISRSAIEWNIFCREHNLNNYLTEEVTHCILSHHGQRQFGSPVAPLTREAWILHLSDSMSARVEDCDRLDMVKINK